MLEKKSFYIVSIIIIIAVLLLRNCVGTGNESTASVPKSPYVDPPFKNIEVPKTVFVIDASKGAVLEYGTTKITVPECAFLDKQGLIVSDTVELSYREVNDPISIMLSGVPMEGSEGSGKYLESAGMFEMLASRNGEELYANPDCQISVNIQNGYADQNYNFYNLDTTKRQWVQNVANVVAEQLKREIPLKIKERNYEELALREGIVNPIKPRELDKKLFQFKFKTNFKSYPELNIYNGVEWEFAGTKRSENPKYNPWVTTAYWSEMEIMSRKQKGVYVLRLVSAGKTFITTVRPVFDEEDMEYAEYVFDQKYKEYRKFVAKKKEEDRKRAEENALREKKYELTNNFSREVKVAGFGWANLDRFMKTDVQQLAASFKNSKGTSLNIDKVYLFIDSVNSIVCYNKANLDKFSFVSTGKNALLIIDSLANVYVLSNLAFKNIKPQAPTHTFIVTEPIAFDSEADIRKVFKNL